MDHSGNSRLETDRARPNQRRPCPQKHREAHGGPTLQHSRATNCLRRAGLGLESQGLSEAGVPRKLRRAAPLSSEPPQGQDVDRGGDAITTLIQREEEHTRIRLGHVREYQVHVHHPVERLKSIEIQFCHVDDEYEL
ncbi:hypothetical protein FVEG_14815 [Fusarium verticillioides 7600]|uniref:Uncharacterized protein n=1 Tax=Gibberella moniliformis (strain M3125 / FGSC 7600) TaxID=334819 RepID=W7LER6_GIBM7|nr:hypothetical protein FVEG_14815 [Fusarium verticillioides 7600]EWG37958.1 hypothetical protein FVEG_14815 [Fusarium verticillioides 7600]RBR08578.1 hypothetical protein FVER53590_26549 [Fusarium verticillioides]